MNPIRTLAATLHRAMHRLPGLPDPSEAAERHARARARATALAARANRPRHPQLGR